MIHIHGCSKKELHVHDFKFAKLTKKKTVVSTWLEDETVESHLFDDGSPSGGVFEKEKKMYSRCMINTNCLQSLMLT